MFMNMEDKKIIFSIITPNYNSKKKILRAINSLKNNSVIFEHIIIDDCSTDDSFSNVEKLEQNNPDSKLVLFNNSSNVGPGLSRNRGLDFARGQYIIFLDADDYFLDNALDTLYSLIKSNEKFDVLLFQYHMVTNANANANANTNTNTNTNNHLINSIDLDNFYSVDSPVRNYMLDNIISSPWCKCIKADLAKSFRFPNLKMLEDSSYNLDIFINANKVLKTDSILYIFDKTENGSLTRKTFDIKEFNFFCEGWDFFEQKALKDLNIESKLELVASRKIKFLVIHCVSRLVINPDSKVDKAIIKAIRETIFRNFLIARKETNLKQKTLCLLFYLLPLPTIKLLRTFRIF